jgi:hypothetical protein
MGTLIARYAKKQGGNPLSGAVSRGADGNLSINLEQAINALSQQGSFGIDDGREIEKMRGALGNATSVDALRNYSSSYQTTTGGDRDENVTNTWSAVGRGDMDYSNQALNSAIEAFEIQERGQQDAANIAQQGRERAKVANMGAGIASAQRQSLAAAEGAAYDGGEGGTPDVVEGSNLDEGGDAGEGGNENARRRRQSYGGAGLAMRI